MSELIVQQPAESIPPPPDGYGPDEKTWQAGFNDGVLGQTWLEFRRILGYESERERIEKVCEIDKAIAAAQAKVAIARDAYDRERFDLERVERQYMQTSNDCNQSPNHYSRRTGNVFVMLAILLIFADIPLTMSIIKEMNIGGGGWPGLLEQLLVAAGVVVISLVFKLLADPFTRPKYLMPRTLRWFVIGPLSVVIGVAVGVFVIAVLAGLGAFRGQQIAAQSASSQATPITLSGTASATPDATSTATPPAATASAPPAGTPAPAPSGNFGGMVGQYTNVATTAQRLHNLNVLSFWTFVALGLLLPLTGGIFASTGLARVHNVARLEHLEKEKQKQRAAHDVSFSSFQQEASVLEKLRRDHDAARRIPHLSDGRYRVYLHAYERGLCSPELRDSGGLTRRVRVLVTRWLAIGEQLRNSARTTAVATHSSNVDAQS
jgi:hypothetical protein